MIERLTVAEQTVAELRKTGVHVALSLKQNECSCNNRAFASYEDAEKHRKEVEDDSGCSLAILHMGFEVDND